MKKYLFCGDRNWTAGAPIAAALLGLVHGDTTTDSVTIVHGDCRGADRMAGELAEALGFAVDPVPAEWARYGRAAGPKRNAAMLAEHGPFEGVYAFHDDLPASKGTADMVKRARLAGLACTVIASDGRSYVLEGTR